MTRPLALLSMALSKRTPFLNLTPRFICPPGLGGSMRCIHCEKCCRNTEMELCNADIARLERRGYKKDDFSCVGTDKIPRLRNVGVFCFFYDHQLKRCKEYAYRPLGCALYPVNLSTDGEIVTDRLCPEVDTLTREEIENTGKRLCRLLDTIHLESERRSSRTHEQGD